MNEIRLPMPVDSAIQLLNNMGTLPGARHLVGDAGMRVDIGELSFGTYDECDFIYIHDRVYK